MVSEQEQSAAQARAMIAGKLAMGFLLGVGPLIMKVLGNLAGGLPGISGLPFALLLYVAGLGFFCLEALIVLPLLAFPSTRLVGLGLAVGFAITCGILVYLTTHGFWNNLFG